MEWKIGEIRQIDGEWYQCIESHFSCEGCDFKNTSRCSHEGSECSYPIRQDRTSVIFKKLEKVEGPYDDCGTILQRFKIYTNVTNVDTKGLELHIYSNDTIGIEIKQDKKEDMEENKTPLPKEDNSLTRVVYAYVNGKISDNELIKSIKEMSDEYPFEKNNLKPLSLEEAKQGKSVCTRDGRKARIVCFDKNNLLPIVALVTGEDGLETVFQYYPNGQAHEYVEHPEDLMMLIEKKEGWINVYDNRCYNTKEEAMENKDPYAYYMTTVKVSWEE